MDKLDYFIKFKNTGYVEIEKNNFKISLFKNEIDKDNTLSSTEFNNILNNINLKLSKKNIDIFNFLTMDTDFANYIDDKKSTLKEYTVNREKLKELNNKRLLYSDLLVMSKVFKNINYTRLTLQKLQESDFEKIESIKKSFKPGMNFIYKQILMKRVSNNCFTYYLKLNNKKIGIDPNIETNVFKYFMQFSKFDYDHLSKLILTKSISQI